MGAQWKGLLSELQFSAGRLRRATRVGFITALGAGITAALQVSNPLGLTLLFNFALPEEAFSIARGAIFLCGSAIFETLAILLAGVLIDSPAVHITAFVLICFCTTYAIYAVPTLGRLWVWIQVPVVTAFYLVMFMPEGLGALDAGAFSGLAIATGVLLLGNLIAPPQPAASIAAQSVAEMRARLRARI